MRNVILFIVFFQTIQINAQILGPYHLRCEFDFTQGVDCIQETCNDFDTLNVTTHAQKGIYTNGIYRFSGEPNASYLGINEVESLKDSSIALELEFIADHSGFSPLIVIGNSWRELSVEIERDSIIAIRSGDQFLRTSGRIDQNKLYNLKVTTWYTPSGTTTMIYLDDQFLGMLVGQLNIRDFDTAISNTHGGDGSAFKGWWKSLKVYSTNDFTLSSKSEFEAFRIYPNPVTSGKIKLDIGVNGFMKGDIISQDGRLVKAVTYNNDELDVSFLKAGMYVLRFEHDSKVFISRFLISGQ